MRVKISHDGLTIYPETPAETAIMRLWHKGNFDVNTHISESSLSTSAGWEHPISIHVRLSTQTARES